MVLQNSTLMFEHIGIEAHFAEISSTILFFIYTGACVIGMFIVERFPRRALILISGWCSCIFLSLFVLFSILVTYCRWLKFLSLGSIVLYVATFG